MREGRKMKRDDVRKLFEDYFRIYDSGDYRTALNKYYTEDAVFENTRVEIKGKDNIIEWFTDSHALGYTENLTATNTVIAENGIAVELEQEFTGLQDVPNHYVSPLGKGETIKTKGVAAFYRLKDGKISRVRVYCTLNAYNPKVFE